MLSRTFGNSTCPLNINPFTNIRFIILCVHTGAIALTRRSKDNLVLSPIGPKKQTQRSGLVLLNHLTTRVPLSLSIKRCCDYIKFLLSWPQVNPSTHQSSICNQVRVFILGQEFCFWNCARQVKSFHLTHTLCSLMPWAQHTAPV